MKRFSFKRSIAHTFTIVIIASSLFPGGAYAGEVEQSHVEQDYSEEYDTPVDVIEDKKEKIEEVDKNEVNLEEVSVVEEQLEEVVEADNEKKVTVAVIDTGLDLNNPVLKERLADGYNPAMIDENGHGTLMAEIICSQTSENVRILPLKAFDEDGNSTIGQVYDAIMSACERGVDVINLSVSGAGTSKMLTHAIDYANAKGITVVVAAGNNASDVSGFMPGNIENSLTVSATDENKGFAEYSNYGDRIDFAAVGTIIKDHGTEDTADDEIFQGTSIASAYASGYVAYLLDNNENADIQKNLIASAEDRGDAGKDHYYGNGYLSLDQLSFTINTDGSLSENEKPEKSEENVDEEVDNTIHTSSSATYWSKIKRNNSANTVYRSIYENVANSTADSWQSWIDWYAAKGYTYTGYSEARICDYNSIVPTRCWWMKLSHNGKSAYCFLVEADTDSYFGISRHWLNTCRPDGTHNEWYYMNDDYLCYTDTWINCKTGEGNRQAGWFYLNADGVMLTGWHPDEDGRWYYFRIDTKNRLDGMSVKVGEKNSGTGSYLKWKLINQSPSSLYCLNGASIRTNVFLMDKNGKYASVPTYYKNTDTAEKAIVPNKNSYIYCNTGFAAGKVNATHFKYAKYGKYGNSYPLRLVNGDYNQFFVPSFDVYYARNKYAISINKDRGIASTGGGGNYYYESNATLSATLKPGYAFAGWKDESGTVVSTQLSFKPKVEKPTTYTATTKVIPYKIKYDYNGGEGDNPTDFHVESDNITINPPTKPGYDFIGWTGSNGDTPQVNVTIPTGTVGDLDYKANWTINYTIQFCGNGQTTGEDFVLHVGDDGLTMPENVFTKETVKTKTDEKGNAYDVTVPCSFQGWYPITDARYDTPSVYFTGKHISGEDLLALGLNKNSYTTDETGHLVLNYYVVWDEFPELSAKDVLLHSDDIDGLSDSELLNILYKNVVGTDNEDGNLTNNKDGKIGVTLIDFDKEELRQFTSTGSVTITYRATDGVGNYVDERVRLYINSPNPIPQDRVYPNRARCINREYYDAGKGYAEGDLTGYKKGGLMPNDRWYTDAKWSQEIEEAFDNLENENWEYTWYFTHEQVLGTQKWIADHGIGNSEEEGALTNYFNTYQAGFTDYTK